MKNLCIGVIVGMCLVGVTVAASSTFTLREVVNFPDDAIRCFKDGGKAALVGELNETGDIITEWTTSCLVPTK